MFKYKKARHAAPRDGMSTLKKFTVVAVIGLAVTVSAVSAASDGKTAYIIDGEKTYTVAADSNDISAVLGEAGITLGENDETVITEESGDSISIEVKRAYSVSVEADGDKKSFALTSGTVADAIKQAGVTVSPNDFVTPELETIISENTDIKVIRGVKVYLVKNGETKLFYVPEGTVKDALKFAGCELCGEGNDGIKENSKVTSGMTLCVDEVIYRTTTKNEKIEPTVIEEASAAVNAGEKVVKQEGKEGRIEYTYSEKYVNGVLTEKKESGKKVVVKPENKIVLVGTKEPEQVKEPETEKKEDSTSSVFADFGEERNLETKKTTISGSSDEQSFGESTDSDGSDFSYGTLITGTCTAYNEVNGITATGTAPKVGTVAVDPNVIPYGTRLYICSADGSYVYGYAIAEDTGTACMAGDIVVDLYMNSEEECNAFGRQELNIYVLD